MFDTIRWAQISLKWSAPDEAVADYIETAVVTLDLDGFCSTEGKGKRRAVAKRLGRKWRVQSRGEFLIGTRRFTLSRWWTLPLPRYRVAPGADWSNGPHAGTRHFAAMFGNYRVRGAGRRLRVIVTHATSGVQVGGRWRPIPERVGPYKRGMAWLGNHVDRVPVGRHVVNVVQLVCMDSNLEQHLPVWRDYLERSLGLPSIFRHHQPGQGTEGHRLIDTAHTNAPVSGQRVVTLNRAPILDHDLIVFDVGMSR